MQDEALLPVSWRARPRSFVALMSLYESNYIRLRTLCDGDPARLTGARHSHVSGDCELVLEVAERAPYTTTLQLTYLLPAPVGQPAGAVERFPDVRIRIYSDARLAEAQQWANHSAHPTLRALRRDAERELDQRWALNMMLNKWLDYCMERGHRFA
jgi:uncharacterized protein